MDDDGLASPGWDGQPENAGGEVGIGFDDVGPHSFWVEDGEHRFLEEIGEARFMQGDFGAGRGGWDGLLPDQAIGLALGGALTQSAEKVNCGAPGAKMTQTTQS
ncbi:MAG: hypothetical protein ABI806_19460 [Candidatus Solibacter sp.]